jgi:hypothetical protein
MNRNLNWREVPLPERMTRSGKGETFVKVNGIARAILGL